MIHGSLEIAHLIVRMLSAYSDMPRLTTGVAVMSIESRRAKRRESKPGKWATSTSRIRFE